MSVLNETEPFEPGETLRKHIEDHQLPNEFRPLPKEEFVLVQVLARSGWFPARIAAKYGLHKAYVCQIILNQVKPSEESALDELTRLSEDMGLYDKE